ncbi:MAG: TerC family protein [Acetobacteraceae bacterium]|nr:TerC family protein [Acetobacteraceae bacterium]
MDPLIMEQLTALVQVLIIDITLAGDNAVVIGLAVNGLPAHQRRPAIIYGIAGATVLRILFGSVTLQLLAIVGLLLAGGVLLLWVCWKMYRDLAGAGGHAAETSAPKPKTLRQAMVQIIVADVSMSLDNVLAVAGASKDHPWILVLGIAISVVLMGVAASYIAKLLEKHRWIAWVGLLIVLYVALQMIWDGGWDVAGHLGQ